MAVALIPVKELSHAKARLSSVLDATGRRALALAMFRDVLAAALACDALDGVAVVTRDEEILAEARASGAEAMREPAELNEALTSAAKKLAKRGVECVVVIAADIPLATPDAIAAVIAVDADVTVVPSPDGGTNVLVTPPDAFPLLFGSDSARRHLEAARNAGLRAALFDIPVLQLDIDAPADLRRLSQEQAIGDHTRAGLVMLQVDKPTSFRVKFGTTFKWHSGSPDDFPALAKLDGSAPSSWVLVIERQGEQLEHNIEFRWERTKPEGSVRESNIDEQELADEWKRSEELLIAEIDAQIAGYLMLGVNWNRTAEIAMIIVDRAYRGRGLGAWFLGEAQDFALERGLRAVQWEVQNDNRNAIEFALARGFRIAGFHDALYRNDDLERQREHDFRGIALYLTKAIA